MKTTRTLRDFPKLVAAETRLHELRTQMNMAREQTAAAESALASASTNDDATEAHVGALMSGAATLATLTLDATKGLAQQVAEKQRMENYARLAYERQEVEVAQLHGEASNRILEERKGEIVATERAKIAAVLQFVRAHETGRALRSEMAQADIRGAEMAWSLDFFLIEQYAELDEPDSLINRMLRDAEEKGFVTTKESAAIRAGTLSLA